MKTLIETETNITQIQEIIRIKERDQALQIGICLLSLVLIPFTMLFSLYLMGLTHAIGTFYWKYAFRDVYKISGRRIIEPINITVVVLLLAICCYSYWNSTLLGAVTLGMLCIGPVLGIAYYIITIREINFYKKLVVNERA